nr:hypothetical protein [Tanacetum cinerariifolium]
MTTGQRKPEGQWNGDERKAANLDQRLKSLIMFVLPDDQMNSVINCLIAKLTWDDLILYHEGPSDVKENSSDDEDDKRSSHEYMNDLEEEYQARALLAKSKRFFKKEEVSSDDNEMVDVKVLMALAEENDVISKEVAKNAKCVKISMRKRILGVDQLTEDLSSSGQKDLVFLQSSTDDTKVSIPSVERPWLSEANGFTLSNHD